MKHKYIALLNAMLSSGLQALRARRLNLQLGSISRMYDLNVANFQGVEISITRIDVLSNWSFLPCSTHQIQMKSNPPKYRPHKGSKNPGTETGLRIDQK